MRAIDTNVLVRLIVRDDMAQVKAAEVYIARGVWVSHVVLVETVWVLDSFYEFEKNKLVQALELLLHHELLSIQDVDVAIRALEKFKTHSGVDYSDCLILEIAQKAGHAPLGTFDRKLKKIKGVDLL